MVEPVMPPMLKQSGGFRGDFPGAGVGQASPPIDMRAEFIDDGRWIVALILGGKAHAFVEHKIELFMGAFLLFRLGNRCDVLGDPSLLDNVLGGLCPWPSSSQCRVGYS